MSWPQPTPQYGQIERATCAPSMRACIARVLSDIASNPVPSARSRICRMSGHFESNAVSDVMSFDPPLKQPFPLITLLSLVVKRESRKRPFLRDLIAGNRRLILRSNRTFARFQESYYRLKLLRFKGTAERRHVVPTVDNSDDHVVMRQFIRDVGEIGPAATAITLDEMTIEAGFIVKKLRALKNRPAGYTNNFFAER